MNESFLIFNPNPPGVNNMPKSGKNDLWKKMTYSLKVILDNYKKNDFTHQEMKLFNFLEEKEKFEDMTPSHLHKVVKKFMEKIKDEIRENGIKLSPLVFPKDISEFNLNYGNIYFIVNIMFYILENLTTKGKTSDVIKDFISSDKIPTFKEKKINDYSLSQIIKIFNNVKTLNFCLYKEEKDNYNNNRKKEKQSKNNIFYMDPKIVFFFGLFYKAFFKSTMTINYDLNILPIDNYFVNNDNPYLINEEQIISKGKDYKDIIICNLILIKTLQKFQHSTNIIFKMFDSYQIELHSILTNIFRINLNNENNENGIRKLTVSKISGQKVKNLEIKNIDTNKQRTLSMIIEKNPRYFYSPEFNNNYLFFQHLLNLREDSFFDFCFDFNSLDPLLFTYVNYALIRFSCITKLSLILFPHKKFNKRKTTINNYFYNKYYPDKEQTYNYSTDDKKIYYQYLDNNGNKSKNNFILKDEKLLNELFFLFNKNLQSLSVILEKKITNLLTLSIDFSTYNNESIPLYNYDNYSCSIICFIFDLFKILQLQIDNCQIKGLDIFYDDFLDEKSYAVDKLKRKKDLSWDNVFQLNKLKLNHINFNISNISLILPFENFPSDNLMELIVSNLSFQDLKNMVKAFKEKKDIFPVLVKLDISLGIFIEDYSEPLEILLKECLPLKQQLKFFNLKIPFNITSKELIDILYWIKMNHNNDLNIILKIINENISPYIKKDIFMNEVNECFGENKIYMKEIHLLLDYESGPDNQSIKVGINKYQKEELDYYYNFIYCFQKISNNKLNIDDNRKIFENIFEFGGKFKKYYVNIEVNE